MKGQMTYLAILSGIISLVMFVAVYPLINDLIEVFAAETTDETLLMLVRFLPIVMFFSIIFGVLWYIWPKEQYYGRG